MGEEQELHSTTWEEHPITGSQTEEQSPPDPSIGEQDDRALGRAVNVEGVEYNGGEEQRLSIREEDTKQIQSGTDVDTLCCPLVSSQEGTLTTCPPPDGLQEENVVADTMPSMGDDGEILDKLLEVDILVTQTEEDVVNTEGVGVVSNYKHGDDDCGDPGAMRNDCDTKT